MDSGSSGALFIRPQIAVTLGTLATVILVLFSHGALIAFLKRRANPHGGYAPLPSLYEDVDGKTSEKAQADYNRKVRSATSIALVACLSGLGVAVASTVFQVRYGEAFVTADACLRLSCWLLLSLQAVHAIVERRPTVRFRVGVLAVLSAFVVLAELATVCIVCIQWSRVSSSANKPLITFSATQAGLSFLAAICFALIPRRPEVFGADAKTIDGEFTVSLLGRLLFIWAVPIISYIRKHKNLSLDEIPLLADYVRSETLQRTYNEQKKPGRRLWLHLLVYLRVPFIKQIILVCLQAITQFIPQLAMFKLLGMLETRPAGSAVAPTAWLWVIGLFLSMLVTSWTEALLYWLVVGQLAIPGRNLLSALIFLKSTKRKDVKGVGSSTKVENKAINGHDSGISKANGKKPIKKGAALQADDKPEGGNDDEQIQKSRQNTINLVAVDTNRFGQFCASVFIFPASLVRLIISFSFLWNLVGGIPLLAGLVAFFASLPLNILFSKKYTSFQGKVMKLRDIRMAVLTEALQGIRQIKFAAIEDQWQERIDEKRQHELKTLWRTFQWDTGLWGMWTFGPVMLAAALLTSYALIHGTLTASIAFTAIAILNAIEVTLSIVPELTTNALDAWVSLTRIEEYLDAPEKEDCLTASNSIALKNATVAWPADSQEEDPDRFCLRGINVDFPRGELSVITGKTGAGKSLLLSALLGEVDKLDGSIEMPLAPSPAERFDSKATKDNWILDSAVAFVAQIPWIENATIKANITWSLPLDEDRYKTVIKVCALESDLAMLEDGDMTDIGASGINLSGGQRWRISFARALYSRAGILILDDIFSAVDAHVGRQLLEEALTGSLCHGRTRILVTHHLALVISKAKYTVKIENGQIEYAGFVNEESAEIASLLKDDETATENEETIEEAIDDAVEKAIGEAIEEADESVDGGTLRLIASRRRSSAAALIDNSAGAATKSKAPPKQFNEAEGREQGRVKTRIYMEYIKMSGAASPIVEFTTELSITDWRLGAKMWIPLIAVFLLNMLLPVVRSYTIALWARSYQTESSYMAISKTTAILHTTQNDQLRMFSMGTITSKSSNPDLWFYLSIYLALSLLSVVFGSFKYFMTYLASLTASKAMFERILFVVLRAPLRWLDTVPVGRILNRFSADFSQVDSQLGMTLGFVINFSLSTLAITITAAFVSPIMLPVALALFVVVLFISQFYLGGAREIKRLESVSKSPIFEQFGSVLAGIGTIRAFGKAHEYEARMYGRIDTFSRAFWHTWIFNRWMGLHIAFVGAIFALIVASFVASASVDAATAGFVMSFSLQYTGTIISLLRNYANLEMIMNAAERIVEYIHLPTEDLGGKKPPAAWPAQGRLEVTDLVAGYAPDLPPVLKGLSFTVEPHQRVGVVGRTGAGKSTLSLALWRFIHVRQGKVHVDGIDTSGMTLHDLRTRLTIIPQDPVLFSGTVRSNMDPFDEHSDDELYDALERVHLISGTSPPSRDPLVVDHPSSSGTHTPRTAAEANTNIFKSLSSQVSEGGLSLSQGQRQLLCLARTIVRKPKIMLLDEATSAVDVATDVLIQRSIREEFRDSTLLVIAHRLSTIADFDRILVMGEGKAIEYDTPKALWECKGVFYDMCCQSGEKDLLEKIINSESG